MSLGYAESLHLRPHYPHLITGTTLRDPFDGQWLAEQLENGIGLRENGANCN